MAAEILAPAGSQDALDAAIAAGADAVYFALPEFGARAYAANFTLEQTRKNIEALHLAGMKAYITMNTILYEDQMEDAFQAALALQNMGADALIIQDLGLLHLLHERLPELELHASTQLSVTRPEQIEQLKKLGVKRVVLARECTLEQIRACAETGMEIEVFVHGALCISYSGQCQFSAVRYDRSGNRGQCSQPCRMKYTLEKDGEPVSGEEFILSPKDLSLIQDVQALIDAGAVSLKIEGRMKSPAYVYESVQLLKKKLEGGKLTKTDEKKLAVTFSRGFTKGYIKDWRPEELMTRTTNNHRGIPAGTVLGYRKGRVQILLKEDLAQNDGIRFEKEDFSDGCRVNFLYDASGKLVPEAKAGQKVEIKVSGYIPQGAQVLKTVDSRLEKQVEHDIQQTRRQIPLKGKAVCQGIGCPLELTVSGGGKQVAVSSSQPAQQALKKVSDAQVIAGQLEKTGNSFGWFEDLTFDLADGIFFPLPVLNSLRREALEALEKEILKVPEKPVLDYDVRLPEVSFEGLVVQIQKQEQKIDEDDVLWISEFPLEGVQKKASLLSQEALAVSHLGKGDIIYDMNVTNSYAAAALVQLGYKGISLSDELSMEQTEALMDAFEKRYGFSAPVLVTVYQKRRLMIMKYCPLNTRFADGKKKNCSICRNHRYEIRGLDCRRALLYGDSGCSMRLFETEAEDKIEWIPMLESMGIHGFSVIFIDESGKKVREILSRTKGMF